jgi:hypothetical protein
MSELDDFCNAFRNNYKLFSIQAVIEHILKNENIAN